MRLNIFTKLPIVLATTLFLLSVPASISAFQAGDIADQLRKVPAGQTVLDFLDAINSGELEKMKAFHRSHGGQEDMAEQDMQFARQSGGIVPARVLKLTETNIELLVQTKSDKRWMKIGFEIENRPPYGLMGLDVMPGSPPDADSDGPPKTEPPVSAASEADAISQLGARLDELVAADEFSGVVLVARKGKPVFQKAYGLADKENNLQNRLDTKFNLGSINKMFTRIAILQLIAKGKFGIDDKLGKVLPDYPNKEAREKVTVSQLLEMTSGIGDFFNKRYDEASKEKIQSLKDYLPFFADKPLEFEPGTRNMYSNGGYLVLGLIIEKASGMDYYTYVKKNIFEKAGMKNTDSYSSLQNTPNLAKGYTKEGGTENKRIYNDTFRPGRGSSAGGGYSTAGDLLLFANALKEGKFQTKPGSSDFGGIGIAGGAPGINALLETGPDPAYTIIVMSNYDPPSAEQLGRFARKLLASVPR